MKAIRVHASKHRKQEIDIFGAIGDSFFEEGNTLESVRAEIEPTSELIINIASLGGDAFEGLAIHDLIASHKAPTTVNIIGATASAGAVISQAGDTVNISENALFLIHNSRGLATGTAIEVREQADLMDKVDERMLNIFVKSTGGEEKEIKALLIEDKFIDAEEAKERGFVQEITEASRIAASFDYKTIAASKAMENLSKEQIKLITNNNQMDFKEEFTKKLDAFKEEVSELKAALAEKFKGAKEIKILDEGDLGEKLEALEASINGKVSEFDAKSKELTEKTTEVETLTTKVTELEADLAKANGTQTTVEPTADPTDLGGGKGNEWDTFANNFANRTTLKHILK